MAGGGAVHKFPVPEPDGGIPVKPTPVSSTLRLGPAERRELLDSSRSVLSRAKMLVDFLDHHRDVARMAGIETIAVEASSILEGGRLHSVVDALEDASRRESDAEISFDGFDTLRRSEMLLAEAVRNIDRYTPLMETQEAAVGQASLAGHPQLSQATPTFTIAQYGAPAAEPAHTSNTTLWAIFSIFAVAVTAGITYLIVTKSK